MTKQEKITEIFDRAHKEVQKVLDDEEYIIKSVDEIDASMKKVMSDTFEAKTLLADVNNIDQLRYGMLEFIPDDAIETIYESMKKYATSGEVSTDSEYLKYCVTLSEVMKTDFKEELDKNIGCIIFRHKKIKNDNTRFTD